MWYKDKPFFGKFYRCREWHQVEAGYCMRHLKGCRKKRKDCAIVRDHVRKTKRCPVCDGIWTEMQLKYDREGSDQDFLDLAKTGDIELRIRSDGKVIWVNTERQGCVLRICNIDRDITIEDERRKG